MDYNKVSNDDIDIRRIIIIIRKQKKTIFFSFVAFFIFSLGVLCYLFPPSYEAKATLLLNRELDNNMIQERLFSPMSQDYFNDKTTENMFGISYAKYKIYVSSFEDINNLTAFIRSRNYNWSVSNQVFKENIKPIFGYNDNPNLPGVENRVVGIQLVFSDLNSSLAEEKVLAVGEYIKTSVINATLNSLLRQLKGELVRINAALLKDIRIYDNDNAKIAERLVLLNSIQSEEKSIGANENLMIEINKYSEKYLSPQSQLTYNKLKLFENNVLINEFRHRVLIGENVLKFIEKVFSNGLFLKNESFDNYLEAVDSEKKIFLDELENAEIKDGVSSLLNNELSKVKSLKEAQLYFASAPMLPTIAESLNKFIAMLIATILSGIFSITFAFIANVIYDR